MEKRKKGVIIGMTILILATLILLGLAYAYYRTRIVGNSEETTISVRTENLQLTYVDGDGSFDSGLMPISLGSKFVKNFAVEDTGDISASSIEYNVVLENLTSSFARDDWTYKLYVDHYGYPNIDDELEDLLVSEGKILNNVKESYQVLEFTMDKEFATMNPGTNSKRYFTLVIEYPESAYEDQSVDMGKSLSFKVNIINPETRWNNAEAGTLLYALKNNNTVKDPVTKPGEVVASDEAVLASTEDDYGTSYYFRGNVENNYVTYANMCWRIVRVQGNGGIKLALADEDSPCSGGTYSPTNDASGVIKDKEMGYETFGVAIPYTLKYETTLEDFNYATSNLKAVLESWLNGGTYNLAHMLDENDPGVLKTSTFTKHISEEDQAKLEDAIWCQDLTGREDESGDAIEYPSYIRIEIDGDPTLKCEYGEGLLKHTSNIGVLTAEELVFAGFVGPYKELSSQSSDNYLLTNSGSFTTISPMVFPGVPTIYITDYNNNGKLAYYSGSSSEPISVRPSVVLKGMVKAIYDSESEFAPGTYQNPYIVN